MELFVRGVVMKKVMLICSLALCWAQAAQAGFLGNNLEAQLLQSLVGQFSVPVSPGEKIDIGATGVTVDVGDTTIDIIVPADVGAVDLTFSDVDAVIDDIVGVTYTGPADISFGPDFLTIEDLPGGSEAHLDVSFAPAAQARVATQSVPEPAVVALMALGLLGMAWVRRRGAR